jgi:hypothetical protein
MAEMTQTLSRLDRLRIERAVWTLDSHLQDLPWRSRVAKRREMRDNLHAAAADVGAAEALRRLGNVRRLAAEYLTAEYGEWRRRPSGLAGLAFLLLAYVVLDVLQAAGTAAFTAGVAAAGPRPVGTFHWNGVAYLLDDATLTFDGGASTVVGGAWTPLVYLCLIAGFVLTGRLWRLLPAWRRRQARAGGRKA